MWIRFLFLLYSFFMQIMKICRRSHDMRAVFARNWTCRRYTSLFAAEILGFDFAETFDAPISLIQSAVLHPAISSTNHRNSRNESDSMMVEIGTECWFENEKKKKLWRLIRSDKDPYVTRCEYAMIDFWNWKMFRKLTQCLTSKNPQYFPWNCITHFLLFWILR